MKSHGLMLLAGLAAAASATAGPESSLPVVRLPAAYGAATSALTPAALDRWWILFDDPELNALEAEASTNASDARTAAARILEARATRAAQKARTLPSGSISGKAGRDEAYQLGVAGNDLNPTSGVTDAVSGGLNLSWELDLFGRLAVARRVADANAAEARFNVEGTRSSLAAEVADTYFQAVGLTAQAVDAHETVRIRKDLLAVAARRNSAGAGPADDVDRAAGEAAQAEAQAAGIEGQLEVARRALLILVGRPLDAPDDLRLAGLPPEAPRPPKVVPAELLTRRPDVREAEYRFRSELGGARLAHLAVFPTITLLPGLGLSSTRSPGVSYIPPSTLVSTQQTNTTGFWSLAAGISAPVLDIPRLLQEARAEDARSRQAAIVYERTVRTAFGEAQNALTSLEAGSRSTALLVEGESRSEHAFEGARRRYAQGLGDLTAMLSAEQSWRSIHSALTSERIDTLRRAVRTYKALGGGWASASAGSGF